MRAFDLARGLAMLFMVAVHVLIRYRNITAGSPAAAPVLLFLMGVSLAFSRQSATSSILHRGLNLLILAHFLNFVPGTLLAFLGLCLGPIRLNDIQPYTPITLFWVVESHWRQLVRVQEMAGASSASGAT